MAEWLDGSPVGAWGDPSRLHAEAMATRERVESDRAAVATLLGARPREIVFCSGATEAIATVGFGAAARGPHSVLAPVEHSAVRAWAERGPHTLVGVDAVGRCDPEEVAAAITAETGVVHLQVVNHEVGTLSDVASAVEAVRQAAGRDVLIHVDAAAATGHVPVDVRQWGADLVSVSAHKFGGPPGIGALFVRRGVRLAPLMVGGDQERARRAGQESSLAIAGFAAAAVDVAERWDSEADAARRLTDRIVEWARTRSGVSVLGDPARRAPHLVCLMFDQVEPQPVLIGLDGAGIAVHSGSSCSSEAFEPSPVLEAIGAGAARSMRVSVGWSSVDADVDRFLTELPRVLDGVEAMAGTQTGPAPGAR